MEPLNDAFEVVGVPVDLSDMSSEFFRIDGPNADLQCIGKALGGDDTGYTEVGKESSDCSLIHGQIQSDKYC